MKKRTARVGRKTRETDVTVELSLDGSGRGRIETGLPFLNHMLELFARHSLADLTVRASGDLEVDFHHTVEDIGLSLGEALNEALGKREGISRYGWSYAPMDDALSRVVVDLGGRPYLVYQVAERRKAIRGFDLALIREFMQAMSVQGRMNLHIAQLYGVEPHHAYESIFKALAKAMRMAWSVDFRVKGVPSSKGMI